MKRTSAILLLIIGAQTAHAQDDLTVLQADKSFVPRRMLYEYLRAEAKKHFDVRRKAIAAISTPEDLRKRQSVLRAKFIEALGGFPKKTPLNARVVGKMQRDGYRIEKVIFESRPRHHVTATLYLPDGKPPFPGVLMPIGHSITGKAAGYVQRGSILLAKNGIAVLAYDPIGQGERRQLLNDQGKAVLRGSTTEHTMIGIGALLVDKSTATYRIWDGIRSLDYLAGRPEVDAKRLGCTGCSGGGTLTSYLMALDDRIVAAAPSCYITSLERLFATIGPQDAEQNITGQVALGMEHVDYLTMRAPRPTLICAATRDFFDIKGTWTSFREAKLLYGLLGYGERVSLVEYNTKHGYPKPQREAVVRWMRRWLLHKDDTPVEGSFDIADGKDLQCTRSGQVLADLRGKSVFHLNVERAKRLAGIRSKRKLTQKELLQKTRKLIALPEKITSVPNKIVGHVQRADCRIFKTIFTTEPGIQIPALHFVPKMTKKDAKLFVYVHEHGMQAAAKPGGPIEKLIRKGDTVLALDPRGIGETSAGRFSPKSYFGPNFRPTFLSLHLNRPLLGQRVYDVLAVIETVTRKQKQPTIHLIGVGMAGPIALHAAAFDDRIAHVKLERSIPSWAHVVQTPISYNQLSNVVPGALAVYDLPELAATLTPRTVSFAGEQKLNVPPKGFRALFNGKNLDNWKGQIAEDPRRIAKLTKGLSKNQIEKMQREADKKTLAHWKAENGVIHYDGTRRIGNLESREHFGNFEMYIDWKIPKGGDSGIFPRNMPQVQIWDPAGGKRNVLGSGGLDNNGPNIPPKKKADNPVGAWNTFYIKFVGEKIWVKLNGVTVIDGETKGNYWKNFKEPPPKTGPIVLQSHGSHLWFRNIFIRELDGEKNQPQSTKLAKQLQNLDANVLSEAQRKDAAPMINRDIRERSKQANARNRAEWYKIKKRSDWEKYRDVRLERLRKSLGTFPPPPKKMPVRVTGTVKGDGFRIENIVYESRPGNWVTGNLYVPEKTRNSMPGILITHAHHRPKEQGEMQDMGMTWARAGCLVLVIDQVGYGERRAHPFNGPKDYAKNYKWWRQDYYYRYDSGIQLQLAGDSLMGWMVWDLMRGVDLLLQRDGIDPKRIMMLGAVAGGGDPCGVTAALDHRIAAAVPFNFGGPQPETRYPLPEDAETSFNYMGGSYWESTRGLRRTAIDGFFHWIIVGGIAPRRLVHAHEFSWDKKRDPVWKRYQKIYGEFYNSPQNLSYTHGKGLLRGRPPEASHCTNIGKFHRQLIHPAFKRWFGISVTSKDEYSARRNPDELICMTSKARRELKPRGFVDLVTELAAKRAGAARNQLAGMSVKKRREHLRKAWANLLGPIQPKSPPRVLSAKRGSLTNPDVSVNRILLEVEPGIVVPVLLLVPQKRDRKRIPVVVALAQAGKQGFLQYRSGEIAQLLHGGSIVCLPDLRGTGETRASSGRGRTSGDGNRLVNMLLFGETVLGQRLRDLRSVLVYLRGRKDVDDKRISLWGESFAKVNPKNTNYNVPRGVGGRPLQSEPLGGLLALFGALYDDDIHAVYIRGGLSGYQSVLTGPHVYIPHDVVIPGALTAGDLCDIAAAIAPCRLRLDELVDGLNRRMPAEAVRRNYHPAIESYRRQNAQDHIELGGSTSLAAWLFTRQ